MVGIGNLSAEGLWVGSVKANSAFIGNKQVWEATPPEPTYDGLKFTALQAGSTVKLVRDGNAPTVYLQYSTDGSNWDTYTTGNSITLSNVGDYVCFRATTTNAKFGGGSNSARNRFAGTGKLKVSGNINSLLDGTNYNTLLDLSGQDRILQFLFVGNTALVDAEDLLLPATKITGWAYCNMFEGCTSLVKGPKEISATDMSNSLTWPIAAMFYNCPALLDGPHIKATSFPNNCCVQMFDGCTSLSSITMDYTGSFGTGVFNNWVRGVAASGKFYYNGTTTTRGASYVPDGWTITPFTNGGI